MIPKEKQGQPSAVYARATIMMARAYTVEQYKRAGEMFYSIDGYKDAGVLAGECMKIAEETLQMAGEDRRARVCSDIQQLMCGKTTEEYRDALILLTLVPDWDEVEARTAECYRRIEEIEAQEAAAAAERERQEELERQLAARKRRRKRVMILSVISLVVLSVTGFLLWKHVIDPAIRYKDAQEQLALNNVVDAYEGWESLGDYKDSAAQAAAIFYEYKEEKLKVADVGDRVFLGTYEQDGNAANGAEAVEWIVLAATEERVLVVSKYAIERRTYHSEWVDITWEDCTLRSWLNTDFIDAAFTAEEQARIPTVDIKAEANPGYPTPTGGDTQDRVFLLSLSEAETYFASAEARKCVPTAYAAAKGARIDEKTGGCNWWLRTPGFGPRIVTQIFDDGRIFEGGGGAMGDRIAVRPALWIERNA